MNEELINQYKMLHTEASSYGAGATYSKKIIGLCREFRCKTALDYGCGKGRLADIMNSAGIVTDKYDPAIPGFDKIHKVCYDMVVANDVLEHLHPSDYKKDIDKLISMADKAVFLNISCRPAVFKLPNGENCHTLVRDKDWWLSLFRSYLHLRIESHRFGEANKNLEMLLLINESGL